MLIAIIISGIYGCNECSDCVPRKSEPGIRVSFFADEELKETRRIFDSLVLVLKADRALLDTIQPQYKDTLSLAMESLISDSSLVALKIDHFVRGKTWIDEIGGLGSEAGSHFADTLVDRNFILPLNMNGDKSVYYFHYFDRIDTLALEYIRTIGQNLDGVRMQISNLSIDKNLTTFDSVRLNCRRSNCINSESTIEIYF